MSAAELARRLDVPTNRITEILNGRRAITPSLSHPSHCLSVATRRCVLSISLARVRNFG
jgi:hypothetical protein